MKDLGMLEWLVDRMYEEYSLGEVELFLDVLVGSVLGIFKFGFVVGYLVCSFEALGIDVG